MMERMKLLLVSLVISLFLTGQVGAITITDVYDDLNTLKFKVDGPKLVVVEEDYNEKHLIPYYPSHDGYAIVNSKYEYFDKVVTLTDDDLKCCCKKENGDCKCDPEIWTFKFQVHNNSPYAWSDYHFEFWNKDFTERYDSFPLEDWDNEIFENSEFVAGNVLQFWAPDWQDPGDENQFSLGIDLSQFAQDCPCTCENHHNCICYCENWKLFGIRQVATTVPEPTTLFLLGTGLIGLGWGGRRKVRG